MRRRSLVLLLSVVMVVRMSACADATNVADDEAAWQRRQWLTGVMQSVSGQVETLLSPHGQRGFMTLGGVGEWVYWTLWSHAGAKASNMVAESLPPPPPDLMVQQHLLPMPVLMEPQQLGGVSTNTSDVAMATSEEYFTTLLFTCSRGTLAALSGAQFDCPGYGVLSAASYVSLPQSRRNNCHRVGQTGVLLQASPEEFGQMCVCPPDMYQMNDGVVVYCEYRSLMVSAMLAPEYRCPTGTHDVDGKATYYTSHFCIEAERLDSLTFTVNLHSSWASNMAIDDALQRTLTRSLPYPSLSSTSQWLTSERSDTYANLVMKGFGYAVAPHVMGETFSFSVSSSNPRFGRMSKFSTIFSFTEPEVMANTTQTELIGGTNTPLFFSLFGGVNGASTYTVTYDLGAIPDTCLESGEMYMETGFDNRRGSLLFLSFSVAHIHISFPNLSKPKHNQFTYKQDLSSGYIFLIVVVCLIVAGAALAIGRSVYLHHLQRVAQAMAESPTDASSPYG